MELQNSVCGRVPWSKTPNLKRNTEFLVMEELKDGTPTIDSKGPVMELWGWKLQTSHTSVFSLFLKTMNTLLFF